MKRRLFILFIALCLALPAFGLAANASATPSDQNGTVVYVATANRGTLNVRSRTSTAANNILDTLNWGDAVTFLGYDNSSAAWMKIRYMKNGYLRSGYVMSVHMSFTSPSGSRTVAPQPYKTPLPTVGELNFSAFRQVTPYAVYASPTRATGWVNLRWAPSTAAEVIQRCYQYRQLIVISQSGDWAQVYDPESGVVGFISRSYIKQLGYSVSIWTQQQ